MIGATLGVAALFAILVLITRPGAALGLIVMSMLVWPEYHRVPVALAQMSVPRLVALVLLMRLLAIGRHKKLVGSTADKLVVFVWAYTMIALLISGAPTSSQIESIGQVFDTVLIYFIARLALISIDDAKQFVWPVAITAMIMGLLGSLESIYHYSPYRDTGATVVKAINIRLGFYRAQVSTGVHIYFGMAMMILTALLWSMRKTVGSWIWLAIFAGAIGTLSSMSSGPWLGLITVFFLNLFALKPNLIKPTVMLVVFLALFLEVASNRHFYNLIDYLALNSLTAWYRTRLLEVAINHIGEYWILGLGDKSIDKWAVEIDGRAFVDIVNHYVLIAVKGGLPPLFAYIGSHVIAVRAGIRAWRAADCDVQRTLLFGLCAALIGLDFSNISVSLFGPPLLLSSMLLGILVSIATTKSTGEALIAKGAVSPTKQIGNFGVKSNYNTRKTRKNI